MEISSETLLLYFRDRLGADIEGMDDTTPLFSSSVLDSFSIVEVIAFIEAQAGIKMDVWDVTLENLDTIERIKRYVQSKQV